MLNESGDEFCLTSWEVCGSGVFVPNELPIVFIEAVGCIAISACGVEIVLACSFPGGVSCLLFVPISRARLRRGGIVCVASGSYCMLTSSKVLFYLYFCYYL
jgi:hypothetical protein